MNDQDYPLIIQVTPQQYEDLKDDKVAKLTARIAELESMVKNAYNAGFTEGMKEHTSSRGGIPWHDSRFRAALGKDKG